MPAPQNGMMTPKPKGKHTNESTLLFGQKSENNLKKYSSKPEKELNATKKVTHGTILATLEP